MSMNSREYKQYKGQFVYVSMKDQNQNYFMTNQITNRNVGKLLNAIKHTKHTRNVQ